MKKQRGFTLIEILIALWVAFCVGMVGFGAYVAIHFIHKFW